MPVKACKSLAGTVTVRNGSESAACGWARRRPFMRDSDGKLGSRISLVRNQTVATPSPDPPCGPAGRPTPGVPARPAVWLQVQVSRPTHTAVTASECQWAGLGQQAHD